ncbi:glutamate racemase [Marinilabilia sp.]|uniref:glutamate racemase n=1 Tax=Marinilabilia sp. TaxID=2021252 RepID=UPI0025C1EB01|nr:glutamate racemase [Marinilabilia sp.]
MDKDRVANKGSIGVFDSGYGGLTILNEFLKEFPDYDFTYLGDNARTPYGTRSFDMVYQYTRQSVMRLFEMGCQLVILACNTASAKALRTIQQNDLVGFDSTRRVLGVVRPSVEKIGEVSRNGHVGVVGTTGTVQSLSYPLEIQKLFPGTVVAQQACPMWVPLVENDERNTPGAEYFVKRDLTRLFEQDNQIDTLILGCTHYPLLLPVIERFIPAGVRVMSQGTIVAQSLREYLIRHPEMDARCTKNGTCRFFTTENPAKFNEASAVFLEQPVDSSRIEL